MVIPHFFVCPISLDLFRDPVTLCTGQTYERSSIEKWFATGNMICPVTMQKLHDPSLVPNHTLRHLISQWLEKGHYLGTNEFVIAPSFSLVSIRQKLESPEASLENKLDLLSEIENLSEEHPDKIYGLIQLGLVSLLVELVFGIGEGNLNIVEKTLVCAIKLLPLSDARSLNILEEESKFARLVHLFDHGNLAIKKSLCQLLVEAISSSLYTKDFCIAVGNELPLLREMVYLVFHDNNYASEAGIKSISALCSYELNKENSVRAGVIQGLITYISRPKKHEKSMVSKAMATLEDLLRLESAKVELLNDPNGVKALVKMVFRISDNENCESAVNSLMILCYDSFRAREEAISAGVLTQLLLLLQSQCNERTKTKATMLLKLLTSYM